MMVIGIYDQSAITQGGPNINVFPNIEIDYVRVYQNTITEIQIFL